MQSKSTFNGNVDANHGYTPKGHVTHDQGMAMDLSIADYKSGMFAFENNVPSQQVRAVQVTNPGHWSNQDADRLLQAFLGSAAGQRQDKALADLFSLYAVTQKGAGGSRDALAAHIQGSTNTSKVLNALFGDGTQKGGLINGVIIGGTEGDKYTYPSMRYALSRLGFQGPQFNAQGAFLGSGTTSPGTMPSLANNSSHWHHFHIYLQPPQPVKIENTAMLHVAEAPVSERETTMAAAQKQNKFIEKKLTPDIVRKIEKLHHKDGYNCVEYTSDPNDPGFESTGRVIPGSLVFNQLKVYNIKLTTPITTRVTQPPKHGTIVIGDEKHPIYDRDDSNKWGKAYSELYRYVPNTAYLKSHEVYEDSVSFEVEVNGYKFRLNYVIDVNGGCKYPENEDEHSREGHNDNQPAIRLSLNALQGKTAPPATAGSSPTRRI